MTERHEAQQKYYMLILSLLIHLGILIVLLRLTKTDQFLLDKMPFFQEHTADDQKQLPIPNNNLAALKSRASTFGAPIIFHEEPEVQAHSGDLHGNDTIELQGDTYEPDTQATPQITTQKESDTQEQKEELSSTDLTAEKSQEKNSMPEDQFKKISKISSILAGTLKKSDELKKEKPEEQTTEQEIKEEPAKTPKPQEQKAEKPSKIQVQKKVSTPNKQIRKKAGQKRPGDSVRTATPAKKQLTLADLAEGFLNTLNRGGKDWLDRDGDPNTKPDFSDLKYMSYIRKVVWYMQNEWHATQNKLQINLAQDCILGIIITFAKDGSVQNIRVIQESGSPQLDEFLIKGIRRAGPYPPLPHHFNTDTFDLPLNIHNSAQSAQPWQMNLSSRSFR